MKSKDTYQKYSRQILLREFGKEAQQKLLNAKILVIGAGGLGCPALQYLTAAGVGTIGIVDFDIIDISNLHRQPLYGVADIGKSKASSAVSKLKALNPDIEIHSFDLKLDNKNALQIISDYEVIIDGSDNYLTRYIVNDACVILDKPLIYGAVLKFEGQAGVFNFTCKEAGIGTNYRDLFPKPPDAGSVISCNEAGVLGVVPGIIGTIQAAEAIKIITGIGDTLCNEIVSYNLLTNSFHKFHISHSEESESLIPKSQSEFINYDYEKFCGLKHSENEISAEEFDDLISKERVRIIDVREEKEILSLSEFKSEQILLSELEVAISSADQKDTNVMICQTGVRSLKAVENLKQKIPGIKAFSLAGGIDAWEKHHKNIKV